MSVVWIMIRMARRTHRRASVIFYVAIPNLCRHTVHTSTLKNLKIVSCWLLSSRHDDSVHIAWLIPVLVGLNGKGDSRFHVRTSLTKMLVKVVGMRAFCVYGYHNCGENE